MFATVGVTGQLVTPGAFAAIIKCILVWAWSEEQILKMI